MPTAMEIAYAKAAMRKAKKPNIDWSDVKAAEAAVKKYPMSAPMPKETMRVEQTPPKAKAKK